MLDKVKTKVNTSSKRKIATSKKVNFLTGKR